MMNNKELGWGLVNSFLTVLYVVGVAWFLTNAEQWFGGVGSWWGPVMFLSLFIMSALLTASLMLGRPIWLYLNNHNRQAVEAFFATLGWFMVMVTAVFIIGAGF